jgi:Flp pilus assembly protein TadG
VSKGVFTVRHFRRSGQDDGAAAVEFALLFPVFMVLALGIIAAGTAFSRQINVTQAAREASRYGATLPLGTSGSLQARIDAWLPQVDTALQQAGGNSANPIAGWDYRCVAFVQTDSAGSPTSTSRYSLNGAAPQTGACPGTQAPVIPSTQYVQTVLSVKSKFFVLFAGPTLQLDGVSTTPYERTAT